MSKFAKTSDTPDAFAAQIPSSPTPSAVGTRRLFSFLPVLLASIFLINASPAAAATAPVAFGYGNGSSGATTSCPASPLTADLQYTTATLTNCTINTNGWRILATTSLAISGGTISDNGSVGTSATGLVILNPPGGAGANGRTSSTGAVSGTWSGSGSVGGGYAGAAGCSSLSGTNAHHAAPSSSTIAVGRGSGSGGLGGSGCAKGNGAATWNNSTAEPLANYSGAISDLPLGGAGGAGGGGSTNTGCGSGAGGGGGGVIFLASPSITFSSASAISALGGNGGNAGGTGCGNAGGGGGGGGGSLILIDNATHSGSATESFTGGSGGAKIGSGTAGAAGATGTANELQGAPVVTDTTNPGSFVEGDTLSTTSAAFTGSAGITITYQWHLGDSSTCTSASTVITGATSSTYTTISADGGAKLCVVVTATNSAGSASQTSAPTPVMAYQTAPTNTALPAATGTTTVGDSLTTTNGSWSGGTSPSFTYTYQWQDCTSLGSGCTNVTLAHNSTAQSATYALNSLDVGLYVDVIVKATNTDGGGANASATSTTPTSYINGIAPSNTVLPAVTGTTTVGNSLTSSNGQWSGVPLPTYSYQWQDCTSLGSGCVDIAGATTHVYTLTAADVGEYVQVIIRTTNSTGRWSGNSSATSVTPTASINGTGPTNTAPPTVTGTTTDGQTLTTDNGSWSAAPTATFTYQWYDCSIAPSGSTPASGCSLISGATDQSYTLTATDVGYYAQAVVTADNSTGQWVSSATSASVTPTSATADITPANTAAPNVTGTTTDGQTLTTDNGTFTGDNLSYGYQWCTSGTGSGSQGVCATGYNTISGATSSTYLLTDGDVGNTLESVVTATNSAGASQGTSSATSTIQAP